MGSLTVSVTIPRASLLLRGDDHRPPRGLSQIKAGGYRHVAASDMGTAHHAAAIDPSHPIPAEPLHVLSSLSVISTHSRSTPSLLASGDASLQPQERFVADAYKQSALKGSMEFED